MDEIQLYAPARTADETLAEMLASIPGIAGDNRAHAARIRATAFAIWATRSYLYAQADEDRLSGEALPGEEVVGTICLMVANMYVDLIRGVSDEASAKFTAYAVLDDLIAQIQATIDRVFEAAELAAAEIGSVQ